MCPDRETCIASSEPKKDNLKKIAVTGPLLDSDWRITPT